MYLSWRVFCVMVAVQAFSSFPSLLIYKLLILKISNWKWSATTYISTIISTVTTTVIACQPLFRDQVTEAVHTRTHRVLIFTIIICSFCRLRRMEEEFYKFSDTKDLASELRISMELAKTFVRFWTLKRKVRTI